MRKIYDGGQTPVIHNRATIISISQKLFLAICADDRHLVLIDIGLNFYFSCG